MIQGRIAFLFLLAVWAPSSRAAEASSITEPISPVSMSYRRLAHTINFDQAIYATPDWGVNLRSEHYELSRSAGFTAIRLPIDWTKYAARTPPYAVEPSFFRRVDSAIEPALSKKMAVILDYHEDKELMSDPGAHRERFLSLWRQIAEHYRRWDQGLLFEVMAEPHDELDALWNGFFADALSVIRETNPERTVLVGPSYYNSVKDIDRLRLPADKNLIVCIHVYRPIKFVFQGEDFLPSNVDAHKWLGTRWTGSPAERKEIRDDFDKMEKWSTANGRPLFVEEFGSTTNADMKSRALWTAFLRHEAEARGFSWGFWAFGPTFALYNFEKRAWQPDLLKALFP